MPAKIFAGSRLKKAKWRLPLVLSLRIRGDYISFSHLIRDGNIDIRKYLASSLKKHLLPFAGS